MKDMKEITKDTKRIKVLYIEDEEQARKTSLELFKNFFDDITIAKDGFEGLQAYKNTSFDLIITDIAMPRMDGIELIKKIRSENKNISIVVFSALNDPSYMTTCVRLNIDGYMLKPLNINNVLSTFEKISYKFLHLNSNAFKELFDMDALTQLKSHNLFLQDMNSISNKEIPVIILINIDEFHIYNEIYGLEIGNEILIKFAQQLEKYSSNKRYNLYRMSGDEFVLFEKAHVIDPEQYMQDIEELLEFIADNPIIINTVNEKVVLSLTLGIAFHDGDIYSRANMALNEARKKGRAYLGFSAEIDRKEELKLNLYWRQEIDRALAEKRVHAYYQAIVDKDKKVLRYEALMRIQEDSTLNLISPKEFLDFSKVTKQYIGLTKVIIEEAFDTMLEHNVQIAVNITFHDVENKEISELLRDKISKHNIATKTKFDISSKVIFELLEHSNHDDYDKFIGFINEFKALGVLITIDNFGLGFSNMSKISAIAPNYVKIDSTLMKNIDNDAHAYTLVKAIVKFTRELGIKTIAEHVSSKEIFEISKELGIDEFQGYYFGEPLKVIDK